MQITIHLGANEADRLARLAASERRRVRDQATHLIVRALADVEARGIGSRQEGRQDARAN